MPSSAGRVAISNDLAIIGAHFEFTNFFQAGAAYLFERNTGGTDQWGLVKRLEASTPGFQNFFGSSVAISNDTIIIGAKFEATPQPFAGAAYLFERNIGGPDHWGQGQNAQGQHAGRW